MKKIVSKILSALRFRSRHSNEFVGSNRVKGFTLVELLVSIALFSIVVSIAAGGFVRALRTQRQVAALIAANSNASLAIEQMTREIRTGINFSCAQPGTGIFVQTQLIDGLGTTHKPCQYGVAFTNARGDSVTYRVTGKVLERGIENGAVVNFEEVTASNVVVEYLNLRILERPRQPQRILIGLGVTAKGAEGLSVTRLQTTVSPRD